MIKNMTNAEIYGLSQALNIAFNTEEKYLPAKVNFYIQKNKNLLSQLNDAIQQTRMNIITHYGYLESENSDTYQFEKEDLVQANKELAELLNITQEVSISTIKLSDLDGLDFTPKQMQALLFMIEED